MSFRDAWFDPKEPIDEETMKQPEQLPKGFEVVIHLRPLCSLWERQRKLTLDYITGPYFNMPQAWRMLELTAGLYQQEKAIAFLALPHSKNMVDWLEALQ